MTTKRLTFPAPARCSVEQGNGLWHTKQWGVMEVEDALTAGAWFQKGKHDFASKEAAVLAGVSHVE